MQVESVDPRDIRWEVEDPVFRVYLWRRQDAPEGVPPEHMGFECDEHRLIGARDIGEVLEWARATARSDQTFTVYVEHRDGDELGLIHLMGVDPTEA